MRPSEAQFRAAIREHAGRVERYRRGELTDDEFRPVRLSYGLYYQLDHTSHMQRIKLPAGLLTAEQADRIADIADRFGRGVVHLTTRQDVQLHWIPLERVVEIYEELHAVGITTRGACADSVRNVTGCIHGGIGPDEPFDVTPYAVAVHEYFLFHPLNLTLPRKFKISFSGCAADCAQGVINDIAYYACRAEGRAGFRVLAGGGLGAQPFLAVPVRDFLPAEDVLIMSEAIVRLQHRHGERKNRSRARMKYVVKRWGEERFRAAVDEEFARVAAERGERLRAELAESLSAFRLPTPSRPPGDALLGDGRMASWARANTFAQKQSGYYGVMVQVPLGDLTADQLRQVASLCRALGSGVMRVTNDQNLMVPWISGADLEECFRRLSAAGLASPDALQITDVVSCPGADFCSLAISRSMGMAARLRAHLMSHNGSLAGLGEFRIRISGCPNACGQHHVGDIGLTGMILKGGDGHERPGYSVLVGGAVGAKAPAIGRRLPGKFSEPEVLEVVSGLAHFYRERRQPGERFSDFVRRVGLQALADVCREAVGES